MDKEEEVDIMGNLDVCKITTGHFLSCDYTVHPKWINENDVEEGNFWSDCVPKTECLESNVEVLHSEEVAIQPPEPVPDLIKLEWADESTTKNFILEKDIPASIEEIVCDENEELSSNSLSDQYANYSESYEVSNQNTLQTSKLKPDSPSKNIKIIGPTNSRSLLKFKIKSITDNINKSTLKPDRIQRPVNELTQLTSTACTSHNQLIKTEENKTKMSRKKSCSKFKATLKMKHKDLESSNLKSLNKKIKQGKVKSRKPKIKNIYFGENITINHDFADANNINNISDIVPNKNSEGSDEEIDVGTDLPNDSIVKSVYTKVLEEPIKVNFSNKRHHKSDFNLNNLKLENLSQELQDQLKDISIPTSEIYINENEISELEKFIFFEYFDNRSTKTPSHYLRIRNHIINKWNLKRPKYLSKTSVRNGLKHAGDVNCIGRIHKFLEQIGAINFGCNSNFNYFRPFKDFISEFRQTQRSQALSSIILPKKRPHRVKSTNIINKDDICNRSTSYIKNQSPSKYTFDNLNNRSEYELVKCHQFTKEHSSPFRISITLSTLLCLQLHSLSSNYEVMGFLGGHRVERKGVKLIKYKPCRTSHQSRTMCEMCPVSQVEKSSELCSEGFELLGWFHSHPHFPAQPSIRDIRTQQEMQMQFSVQNKDYPFIGLILSCLNMSFRCIYIRPEDLCLRDTDSFAPYAIDVDILSDCTYFKESVNEVMKNVEQYCDSTIDLIKKFKSVSKTILTKFGYNVEEFYENIF